MEPCFPQGTLYSFLDVLVSLDVRSIRTGTGGRIQDTHGESMLYICMQRWRNAKYRNGSSLSVILLCERLFFTTSNNSTTYIEATYT